nr:hypothetical protein [Tanacetum cinerariifolium]
MSMLLVRVHKFEQKARRKINFDKKESARFNKQTVRYYKCQQEAILPGNAEEANTTGADGEFALIGVTSE